MLASTTRVNVAAPPSVCPIATDPVVLFRATFEGKGLVLAVVAE